VNHYPMHPGDYLRDTAHLIIANQGFFSAIAKKPNKTNCFRFNPW